MNQAQLLQELRAHRRGGPVTPAVAVHLSNMIHGWRQDPTARGMSFDAWCASLADLHVVEKPLVACVRWAFLDPYAHYVPPGGAA